MHVLSNYLSMISIIMRMIFDSMYIRYDLPLFLFLNNPLIFFLNYLSIGLDMLVVARYENIVPNIELLGLIMI